MRAHSTIATLTQAGSKLRCLALMLVIAVVPLAGCAPANAGPADTMELQGRWAGLRLAAVDSSSGRELGIPPLVTGVLVTDVLQDADPRGAQAGLRAGDVITGVDGNVVTSLAELYTFTTKLDAARVVQLDVTRGGQPMRLTLPGRLASAVPMTAAADSTLEFLCPNDGLRWTHAQVHPEMKCPRCGGPLTR